MKCKSTEVGQLEPLKIIRNLHLKTCKDLSLPDEAVAEVSALLEQLQQLLTGISLMQVRDAYLASRPFAASPPAQNAALQPLSACFCFAERPLSDLSRTPLGRHRSSRRARRPTWCPSASDWCACTSSGHAAPFPAPSAGRAGIRGHRPDTIKWSSVEAPRGTTDPPRPLRTDSLSRVHLHVSSVQISASAHQRALPTS